MDYLEEKQTEQNATKAIIKEIPLYQPAGRGYPPHDDGAERRYFTNPRDNATTQHRYETARTDLLRSTSPNAYLIKETRGREFISSSTKTANSGNKKQRKVVPEKP